MTEQDTLAQDTPARSSGRTPLWQVALVFVLLTALYSAVSIQQYNRMETYIFDLGFFESVIRDYAHGNWPQLPLTDTTYAQLHFSPALALLAPVVLVWSSPVTREDLPPGRIALRASTEFSAASCLRLLKIQLPVGEVNSERVLADTHTLKNQSIPHGGIIQCSSSRSAVALPSA